MLKVYNTLSRKKEFFKPIKGKKISLFVCGVTPYDFTHIGHARTYVVFDMVVKYLRQKDYNVFYLQNITDIEDKIIKRANEKGITWFDLSRKFEKEYLRDIKALKANSVTRYARATDHIKEILSQIKRLIKNGYAYRIEDGIYYDISKFKDYGRLSRRTALAAEDAISRIDESRQKRNKGDFCLWKLEKPGEPSWPSPWGAGRPGWHIEDTAIAENFFGPRYDIHGGGRDLTFPHHEAEIAQMEAASGKKPMVRYWLHTGFLVVEGKKMAKSLGNFITIKDFLKNHSARLLRFLILKNHYRSPLDYTKESIFQAEKELQRIDEFIKQIQNSIRRPADEIQNKSRIPISKFQKEFNKAMEDDFNTPKALAAIFRLIRSGHANKENLVFLKETDKFFNFIFSKEIKPKIPKDILKLVELREKYRRENNWIKSDEIREKIKNLGYWVEDTKEGVKIKRAKN